MRGDSDALLRAFEALGQHGHLEDLVARTQRITRGMASERRASFESDAATDRTELDPNAAKTPFGNASDVLQRGPENDDERALACALFAHAIAEELQGGGRDVESDNRLADDILWLATNTPFDATPLLDRALGEEVAGTIWTAIADRVRRVDAYRLPELGRGEALVGCVALAFSKSETAARLVVSLGQELHDPALLRMLSPASSDTVPMVPTDGTPARLRGELVPAPHGLVATTALALSGILFLIHGTRLLARLALAYRCPAEIVLSPESVRVDSRVEMLGRTLREKSTIIGREGLVRAVRDVRYPRVGFYAGLLALALGTYIGVSTMIDGVRAASPSLFLVGLVIIAAGVGLDLLFSSLVPGSQGRCRVVLIPRRGPAVCVGSVDIATADGALSAIAKS
ncbi:hypothetical protein LZC95_31360 [Pendulispora brunnea]|uniref:Uncharacterized protein n=1 Tax=Pendulispora brunnea TaxID=2905690 RepID=A0ABZ2JWZ8_9BACT